MMREEEIKVLIAEAVSQLRNISERSGELEEFTTVHAINQARRAITAAEHIIYAPKR